MKILSRLFFVLVLVVSCFATSAFAGKNDPLFVNLTTDDAHRANMGIIFGKSQMELGHPLTIFLNDKGVHMGSKAQSNKYGDHQKALDELIKKGATVLICPMCMEHYKVKESDLVTGIKVGSPEVTGAALFKDNTQVMSW